MTATRTDPVALLESMTRNPHLPEKSPTIDAPEPFPLHALPKAIRAFVASGATARGVPPEFVAVPFLAFVGAVAGNRFAIKIKEGHIEFPVLWVGIVGKPGTAKTPSQQYAAAPIRAVQSRLFTEWQKAMALHDSIPLAERKHMPAPRLHSVFTTDATIQAVADMLNRRNGLVVERDELSGWTASFDAYQKTGERDLWLSSWGFAPWKVDRKTTESYYIAEPVVCVAGGVQPERLSDLRGSKVDDGFADRFLLAYPITRPQRFTLAEDDPVIIARVADVFMSLHERTGNTTIELNDQARAAYRDFYDANADSTNAATGLAAGWGSKAPRHLARLALVLHLLTERDPASKVALDTMRGAIELTEYFRSHFQRCIPLMGGSGYAGNAGDATRVLTYLRQAAELPLSRSELQQKTRLSADRLTAALESLEREGKAARVIVSTSTKPREDWRILELTYSANSEYSGNLSDPIGEFPEIPEFTERGDL